jgi:uncharacterized membrane protein (UPF0127 family)
MGAIVPTDPRIIERASMEVNGSKHRSTSKFSLQVVGQRWAHRRSSSRRLALRLALVLALASTTLASFASGPAPSWATAVMPGGQEFKLEIAADQESRARGYMHRESIGASEGMLFLFPTTDLHSFWMKNCRTRLDIVWLDERKRIVDVASNVAPCPADGPCPSHIPIESARYVLEFAGGTMKRLGVKRGDIVKILSDTPLP